MTRRNLDDSLIREMIADTHRPIEHWRSNSFGIRELGGVTCRTCSEDWPCSSRLGLNAWNEDHGFNAPPPLVERP